MPVWWQNDSFGVLSTRRFLDIADLVANKATKLLWGSGFKLESKTEDDEIDLFLKDFAERNQLYIRFMTIESILSKYGRAVPVISRSRDNKLNMYVSDPTMVMSVAKLGLTEVAAVIYRQWKVDNSTVRVIEKIDDKKIDRQFFIDQKQIILAMGGKFTVKPGLLLDKVWYHGLGEVPLVELLNKEGYNYFNNSNGFRYDLADTAAARHLQKDLDESFVAKMRERRKNQTYFTGAVNQKTMQAIATQGYLPNDMFLQSNIKKDDGTTYLDIIQGNPPLDLYNKDQDAILSKAFEFSGYTYTTTEERATGDTATGKMLTKGLDIETTMVKRTLRQMQYTRFFDKLLKVAGLWDGEGERPYVFQIKENIALDQNQKLDIGQKALNMGIAGKAEVRQMWLGGSLDDNKKAIQEVEAETPDPMGGEPQGGGMEGSIPSADQQSSQMFKTGGGGASADNNPASTENRNNDGGEA